MTKIAKPRPHNRRTARSRFPRPALSDETVKRARRRRIARIKNEPPFHSDSDLAFEVGFDAAKDFRPQLPDIFAGIATALDMGGTDPAGHFAGTL